MIVHTGEKAERVVAKYAPVARSVMTKNPAQAIAAAGKIKFPLVLKIISPKVIHKTEVNGVRIVNNLDELRKAYGEMMKIANKKRLKPIGILVQEFVTGQELILGIKNDPTFGHVIALGIGGKYVEIIKDITFRACPIDNNDAKSMIEDLKYKQLLFGVRGEKPVNMKLLKQVLVKVSKLPQNKKIEELDINPFIINNKVGKAVDVRVVVK